MSPIDDLKKYVDEITGTSPVIQPVAKSALATLPLYLTSQFDIRQLYLFGEPLLIALIDAHTKPDLAKLARQRESIEEKLGASVVLVIPQLKSYERKRLIQKQIPFIVPGRQMYLPMLLTDLRESFPARVDATATTMSWVAQVIVLRHLIFHDVIERPLSHIATMLGYTPMAISQAVDALVALQLCERVRLGREKRIYFHSAPDKLWRMARPYLRAPVKKSVLACKLGNRLEQALRAGLPALADLTDIASTEKLTIALSESEFRTALEEGAIEICPLEEDALAVVQVWAYTPKVLTIGRAVDPLSLYLCFQDDQDERVQTALEQLLELVE
tara:strand:+ start:1332 stop:2321 length:990 start_codon:yes stop_codon:yes gene_type:complete